MQREIERCFENNRNRSALPVACSPEYVRVVARRLQEAPRFAVRIAISYTSSAVMYSRECNQ